MSCSTPLTINVNGRDFQVPCRWCMACRIEKRNNWSKRIRYEIAKNYKNGYGSSFVTLTYDELHVGDNNLDVSDAQKFLKRLRYYIKQNKDALHQNPDWKYYLVGEYGGQNGRRHFHLVLIGLDSVFANEYCRKSWKYGFTQCAVVNTARVNYLLKYMDKQVFHTAKDDKKQPFSIMSKGIGSDLFKENSSDARINGVVYVNGSYLKYPNYYAKKYGIDTEELNYAKYEHLKDVAKNAKMSVGQYTLYSAKINEACAVSSARVYSKGQPVDGSHSDIASAVYDAMYNPSNIGDSLAKELNNDS